MAASWGNERHLLKHQTFFYFTIDNIESVSTAVSIGRSTLLGLDVFKVLLNISCKYPEVALHVFLSFRQALQNCLTLPVLFYYCIEATRAIILTVNVPLIFIMVFYFIFNKKTSHWSTLPKHFVDFCWNKP